MEAIYIKIMELVRKAEELRMQAMPSSEPTISIGIDTLASVLTPTDNRKKTRPSSPISWSPLKGSPSWTAWFQGMLKSKKTPKIATPPSKAKRTIFFENVEPTTVTPRKSFLNLKKNDPPTAPKSK